MGVPIRYRILKREDLTIKDDMNFIQSTKLQIIINFSVFHISFVQQEINERKKNW